MNTDKKTLEQQAEHYLALASAETDPEIKKARIQVALMYFQKDVDNYSFIAGEAFTSQHSRRSFVIEQEFAQELEKWKLELSEEVINHYREGNEDRGHLSFTRWKERFLAFLKEHIPTEADRLQLLTFHIVAVAKRGEHPLQRFMREDGDKCLAFIDDLAESVRKGRVKLQEKSFTDTSVPMSGSESTNSNLASMREESGKPLIVVITALEEELDYLLDHDYSWSGPLFQQDGICYRRGSFTEGIDIIATSARNMGLVATAIVTAKVLKEWNPLMAAMIGVCGGRQEKGLNIGDIVVANKCFHYQFGAFENGEIARELVVENIEPRITDIAEHLINRTDVLSDIQKLPPRGFRKPNTILRGYIGPMASADLVVKDVEKFGEAIDADRKTIAVDMESYAFMKAAKLTRTQYAFVIKSVSDFADAEKNDDFREYAKFTSTHFFLNILQKLMAI